MRDEKVDVLLSSELFLLSLPLFIPLLIFPRLRFKNETDV